MQILEVWGRDPLWLGFSMYIGERQAELLGDMALTLWAESQAGKWNGQQEAQGHPVLAWAGLRGGHR